MGVLGRLCGWRMLGCVHRCVVVGLRGPSVCTITVTQMRHISSTTKLACLWALIQLLPDAAATEFANEQKLLPAEAGAEDRVGRSAALSGDGKTLILGAPQGFIGSSGRGAAYVYVRDTNGWSEQARLQPADSSAQDQFGEAVDLSEDSDTAAVGSWYANGDPGAAYVFQRLADTWQEQVRLQPDDGPQRYFGWSVALSEDRKTLAVGNPTFDQAAGSLYVFLWDGSAWQADGSALQPNDTTAVSGFGARVDVDADGNTIIIGNASNDSAHVFLRRPGGWQEHAHISAADLGSDVAVTADGATIIVGAGLGFAQGTGAAQVYRRAGPNWVLQATLLSSEPENADWFGHAVQLSAAGDTAVVGANFADVGDEVDVGAAYVYKRLDATWTSGVKITPSDPTFNDEYGKAVALSGDGRILLVGAHNKPLFGPTEFEGAGYVYAAIDEVGGSARGFTPVKVRCTNLTQGGMVTFPPPATTWSCEDQGFEVQSGDDVEVRVRGIAD